MLFRSDVRAASPPQNSKRAATLFPSAAIAAPSREPYPAAATDRERKRRGNEEVARNLPRPPVPSTRPGRHGNPRAHPRCPRHAAVFFQSGESLTGESTSPLARQISIRQFALDRAAPRLKPSQGLSPAQAEP